MRCTYQDERSSLSYFYWTGLSFLVNDDALEKVIPLNSYLNYSDFDEIPFIQGVKSIVTYDCQWAVLCSKSTFYKVIQIEALLDPLRLDCFDSIQGPCDMEFVRYISDGFFCVRNAKKDYRVVHGNELQYYHRVCDIGHPSGVGCIEVQDNGFLKVFSSSGVGPRNIHYVNYLRYVDYQDMSHDNQQILWMNPFIRSKTGHKLLARFDFFL